MSAGLGDQRLLESASFRYVSWIGGQILLERASFRYVSLIREPETVRESVIQVCQLD